MGERLDRLKSALEHAASSLRERAQQSGLAKVGAPVRQTLERRARIPLAHLRRAVMSVPGVRAGSVAMVAREGGHALALDLDLEDDRRARGELAIAGVSFAPHGAKELSFRVTPAEASGEPALREVVGAVAALVARTIWSASLPPATQAHEGGLVDREGDLLRIDLRTLGAVRSAMQRGPSVAAMLSMIAPERIELVEDGLEVKLALPPLGR
jgi:hypothetical protein